ncbi:hypothetical protein C8J56DRAFT_1056528 [Mycena floridula]|nr:hypothetical protein C8J56DRAFT_1056528 [Mycena floridula]
MSLSCNDLFHTEIRDIAHAFARDPSSGREFMKFRFYVFPGIGKDGWRVERTYSEFQALDKNIQHDPDIVPLAKEKLWKDCSPAVLDGKQVALLLWLRGVLLNRALKDDHLIIQFLTTDIVPFSISNSPRRNKQGYLTKKSTFGGWKSRYFVLTPPVPDSPCILEEYDAISGSSLGGIIITGARFSRQVVVVANTDYRHAFTIVEAVGRKPKRHVLCAQSDAERDQWVSVLVRGSKFNGDLNQENLGLSTDERIRELIADDDEVTLQDDYNDIESTTGTLVA